MNETTLIILTYIIGMANLTAAGVAAYFLTDNILAPIILLCTAIGVSLLSGLNKNTNTVPVPQNRRSGIIMDSPKIFKNKTELEKYYDTEAKYQTGEPQ